MATGVVPDEIDAYAAANTTAVSPLLEELGTATQERFGAMSGMLSGQVPGTLLQMLIFASGATGGIAAAFLGETATEDSGGCE